MAGKCPPCPRADRDSLTDARAGLGPSSRSLRAERWRRQRRRRRRGRCSQLGREPCQENTTSQLRPSIPAAVRTVTGPPALLPPLSPHLGPIVWLGAPGGGGGKDAEAAAAEREERERRESERKRRRKRGGIGTGGGGGGEEGEGSPALRGLSAKQTPQNKVISVQASALSRVFLPPTVGLRLSGRKEGRGDPEGAEPKRRVSVRGGTASFAPNRWLRKRRRPRAPPGSGAESRLRSGARTNNLKWQRRPLRHTPLSGTAQNPLRLRRAPAATICAERGGGRLGAAAAPRRSSGEERRAAAERLKQLSQG